MYSHKSRYKNRITQNFQIEASFSLLDLMNKTINGYENWEILWVYEQTTCVVVSFPFWVPLGHGHQLIGFRNGQKFVRTRVRFLFEIVTLQRLKKHIHCAKWQITREKLACLARCASFHRVVRETHVQQRQQIVVGGQKNVFQRNTRARFENHIVGQSFHILSVKNSTLHSN